MKKSQSTGTPVLRNLRNLFREPLPLGPVIVHMTEDEWKQMSRGIRISRKKIDKHAKGLIVTPDPFGGYLGFFACAAGSGAGLACIPEIIRSGGTMRFGPGCFCIRGKDPVDPPTVSESCSLTFSVGGKFVCTGTCSGGKRCHLVIGRNARGLKLITCECSSG